MLLLAGPVRRPKRFASRTAIADRPVAWHKFPILWHGIVAPGWAYSAIAGVIIQSRQAVPSAFLTSKGRASGGATPSFMTRDDWLFCLSLVWFVALLATVIWMLFA